MERKTWKEFSENGMLWWINRILHTMGWSIVIEGDEVYPARTSWLGFTDEINDKRFPQFKNHMKLDVNPVED